MRRIAEPLDSVVLGRLRRVFRRTSIDNEDATARRANPGHLPQRGERIEQVMEGITCDYDREAAVVIGQRVNITTVQCDIAQTALRGRFLGFFEHGRGQVDTRRLAHMRCEGANHKARTACDIEQGVVRPRRGSFDDQPQHRFVLDHGGGAERRGLARKLIEYQILVRRFIHPIIFSLSWRTYSRMRKQSRASRCGYMATARVSNVAMAMPIAGRKRLLLPMGPPSRPSSTMANGQDPKPALS